MIRRRRSKACALAALCLSVPLAAGAQAGAAQTHPATTRTPASDLGDHQLVGMDANRFGRGERRDRRLQQGLPEHQGQLQADHDRQLRDRDAAGARLGRGAGPVRAAAGRLRDGVQLLRHRHGTRRRAGPRQQLAVEDRAERCQRLHLQRQAHRAVGRLGVRRHPVDQRRPVQEVQPVTADHARPVGERM